ncbi:hypothetical protein V6N13_140340 [Hibiscus sabdariffa]|uniref:Uncharacterized protein n=1 Tax=Hibiscus sabdariffa TaxID=183260 RepID=A0ABR2QAQ2_9ROSI
MAFTPTISSIFIHWKVLMEYNDTIVSLSLIVVIAMRLLLYIVFRSRALFKLSTFELFLITANRIWDDYTLENSKEPFRSKGMKFPQVMQKCYMFLRILLLMMNDLHSPLSAHSLIQPITAFGFILSG